MTLSSLMKILEQEVNLKAKRIWHKVKCKCSTKPTETLGFPRMTQDRREILVLQRAKAASEWDLRAPVTKLHQVITDWEASRVFTRKNSPRMALRKILGSRNHSREPTLDTLEVTVNWEMVTSNRKASRSNSWTKDRRWLPTPSIAFNMSRISERILPLRGSLTLPRCQNLRKKASCTHMIQIKHEIEAAFHEINID